MAAMSAEGALQGAGKTAAENSHPKHRLPLAAAAFGPGSAHPAGNRRRRKLSGKNGSVDSADCAKKKGRRGAGILVGPLAGRFYGRFRAAKKWETTRELICWTPAGIRRGLMHPPAWPGAAVPLFYRTAT